MENQETLFIDENFNVYRYVKRLDYGIVVQDVETNKSYLYPQTLFEIELTEVVIKQSKINHKK